MSDWRLVKPGSHDFILGAARTYGKCVRCTERATEVVRLENGHLSAYCRSHRYVDHGLTPQERDAARAGQGDLF